MCYIEFPNPYIGRPIFPPRIPGIAMPPEFLPSTFIRLNDSEALSLGREIKELERRITELEQKLEEAESTKAKSDKYVVTRRIELTEAQKKSLQTKTPASKLKEEGK